MKNNFNHPEKDDKLGEILRSGFPKSKITNADFFTHQVMTRVHALESNFVFPVFLWAVPAVLVVMLAITVGVGLIREEKSENLSLDNLLLADMPIETQNMLGTTPSFSNLLWKPNQGGFLQ